MTWRTREISARLNSADKFPGKLFRNTSESMYFFTKFFSSAPNLTTPLMILIIHPTNKSSLRLMSQSVGRLKKTFKPNYYFYNLAKKHLWRLEKSHTNQTLLHDAFTSIFRLNGDRRGNQSPLPSNLTPFC